MHPAINIDEPLVPCSQDLNDVIRNSNVSTERENFMNLIRKQRRSKISPLLPNPTYLPAFYQNYYHPNYVNQKSFPQRLPVEKGMVPHSLKRKHQDDVYYSEITGRKSYNYDLRTAKTHFLHSITKVDNEIAEIEFEIVKRRKNEQEIKSKEKPSVDLLKQVLKPDADSLFKKIIAENRQKAHEAHSVLLNLGPQLDFPLYKQPCDTAVYQGNKKSFISFKEKLKLFLRKKCVERVKKQKSLLRLYSHLACKWKDKISKVENSRRQKSKEAKDRKYFESVFPELQKKKLRRERNKKPGDHVISEADYQEILRVLHGENLEYTMIKSSSAHPPLLLDSERRSKFFHNKNNLITDVKRNWQELDFLNLWTPAEKAIFKEKFIQFSKDFRKIASFLNKKSVGDCIKYYYLTKKRENFKILGKPKRKHSEMVQPLHFSKE